MPTKIILTPSEKRRRDRDARIIKMYNRLRNQNTRKGAAIIEICNIEGLSYSSVRNIVTDYEQRQQIATEGAI